MPQAGVTFNGDILGGYTVSEESWGRQIFLGPIQYGQTRDVIVPLNLPAG